MSKKKHSVGYYAKKVIYCERLIDLEDNKIIKMMCMIMKKYYTYKWERWYD